MMTPYNYDMLRPRRNLSPDSVTHMFELTNNAHNAHIEQRIRERGCNNPNPRDGRGTVSRSYSSRIGRDWGSPCRNRAIRIKAALNVDR